MNKDVHSIFEAYTAPGTPAVPPSSTSSPIIPVAPSVPLQAKASENEEEKKSSLSLGKVDTDRKAIHAAYDIVELIYKIVKDFETATKIIQTMASVHRNEKKRLKK